MTMRRVHPLLRFAVAAWLLGPNSARAQDTSFAGDSATMFRRVLPPNYPVSLFNYVGRWSIALVRADGSRSLATTFDLVPDSVPYIAVVLQLNHVCYACLRATVSADWDRLLRIPPTSNRMSLGTDSTIMGATIGTTMQIVGVGDLILRGSWTGDSAVGTWRQLESPDSATGTFVMRRAEPIAR